MQYFSENPVQCIIALAVAVGFFYFTFFKDNNKNNKGGGSNGTGSNPS